MKSYFTLITILIFVNNTTYANDKLFTFDKNTTNEEIKAFANHACNTVLIETVKMRIDEHSKAEIDNIIKGSIQNIVKKYIDKSYHVKTYPKVTFSVFGSKNMEEIDKFYKKNIVSCRKDVSNALSAQVQEFKQQAQQPKGNNIGIAFSLDHCSLAHCQALRVRATGGRNVTYSYHANVKPIVMNVIALPNALIGNYEIEVDTLYKGQYSTCRSNYYWSAGQNRIINMSASLSSGRCSSIYFFSYKSKK